MSRSMVSRKRIAVQYTYSSGNAQGFVWDPSQACQNFNDGSHDHVSGSLLTSSELTPSQYFGLSSNLFVIIADAVNLCAEGA
jgi:hypothetical protein